MHLTPFLLRSRGPINLAKRLPTIFQRFGMNPKRIEKCLDRFLDVTDRFGVRPTLPVTAAPLKRHPKPIQHLQDRGVELALHGLVHTDYTQLTYEQHRHHLECAAQVFHDTGIEYFGTRAPYMRSHDITLQVARDLNLLWDSNDVVHWDVLGKYPRTSGAQTAYDKVLNLYSATAAETRTVLPYPTHGLIEIPVSLPDDEALVDRLGWGDDSPRLAEVWETILQTIYERGELYTIQLHHERVPQLSVALENTLRVARSLRPHIWIATLREIAEWWKEKATFEADVQQNADQSWSIHTKATSRARVRVDRSAPWEEASEAHLRIHAPRRPLIALSTKTHSSVADWLSGEGFPHEIAKQGIPYAVEIDEPSPSTRLSEKRLLDKLDFVDHPLVRFERWPESAKAAMSVTGDIDSLTLIDFFLRFKEV